MKPEQRKKWKTYLLVLAGVGLLLTAAVFLRLHLEKAVLPAGPGGTEEPAETPSWFRIRYLDVGEGDSALVECDGKTMLIDGGSADRSQFLYAFLKENGISYLDAVVCTHGHEDHVGGLAGALNYAKVGAAYGTETEYDSRAFRSFAKYLGLQGIQIRVPQSGESFRLGSAEVVFLGPVDRSAAAENENNASLVMKITYGETSFLFTGDAEKEEEAAILDAGADLRCTVLKVAHHGSYTSSTDEFLRAANPKYCVISVGKDNTHNHPHDSVMRRIRRIRAQVYRTDLQGEILCESDGKEVRFQTEKAAGESAP